jgi:zinc protease
LRRIALCGLLSVLCACAHGFLGDTSLGNAPVRKDENGMLRTTLSNGLKVVLVEDHSAPVVALNVWVRTGSADELPGQFGMAHVHEHMLFKGTERRGVGEIAATVEGAGGNMNAFTSYDMTVYHVTMPARDVAVGVDVLGDAVQHSTFDAGELAREEEVVIEEIRRADDSPENLISRTLFETAFSSHPYRRDTLGTRESVNSFTRQGLLDFYHHWYVPNNMTFVAVGDFHTDDVLAQVEKAFAGSSARANLVHPRAPEPEQSAPRAAIVAEPKFHQSLLGIAWKGTSFGDPDTAYLDLLAQVLGGGESSRLYREVKDRAQLVHGISAGSYTPLDPGLFLVDAELDADKLEPSISAIATQVRRLQQFGPTESELERARTNTLAMQVHERETMHGQAQKYGYFELLAGGLEAEQRYLDQIKRATRADLQRVATKYLVPDRSTVVAMLGQDAKQRPEESALVAALRGGAAASAPPIASEELRSGIREFRLPNGLRVVVKPIHTLPLVAVRLSFLGGLLAETEDTQGITSFVADMLTKGTESRSAAQLATDVEDLAAELSGFAGRNSFGISGDFLAESLDAGLDLFVDVLQNPSFEPSEIAKLREERRAALRRREDSPSTLAFEEFQKSLYPGHPYRFPAIGTAATIAKFDQKALAKYWSTYARPENGVLAVVGNVDPEQIVESLRARLTDWNSAGPAPLPKRPVPAVPSAPRSASLAKHMEQSHIVFGFLGLGIDDPDLPALEVLTQVLGGQGGRLFVELRDKKSLAYTVSAFEMEGIDPGMFAVYIAGDPKKLDESLAGIKLELGKVLDEPIGAEELERAKRYLTGSQTIGLQRYGSQAMIMSLDDLYGLGAAHYLDYDQRISAVTLDDVKRAAKRIIRLDAPVVAIVK